MLRAGADVIKICTSGGISSAHDDPDDQDLLDEEIAAVVDEGHRHRGRPVAAHAQGRAGILAAIRCGVMSIEHGFGIDDEGCDLIGERGAFLVPTLSTAFQPLDPQRTAPWRYEKKLRWNERTKENIAAAIARKVNIAVGTDAGITPHGQNLFELSCLVELGMSPIDAIRAATSNSARLLGVADTTRDTAPRIRRGPRPLRRRSAAGHRCAVGAREHHPGHPTGSRPQVHARRLRFVTGPVPSTWTEKPPRRGTPVNHVCTSLSALPRHSRPERSAVERSRSCKT